MRPAPASRRVRAVACLSLAALVVAGCGRAASDPGLDAGLVAVAPVDDRTVVLESTARAANDVGRYDIVVAFLVRVSGAQRWDPVGAPRPWAPGQVRTRATVGDLEPGTAYEARTLVGCRVEAAEAPGDCGGEAPQASPVLVFVAGSVPPPTPSPSPSAEPTPSAAPSPSPSPSVSPSPSAPATPGPSGSAAPSRTPGASATPRPSPTRSPAPTPTPLPEPTAAPAIAVVTLTPLDGGTRVELRAYVRAGGYAVVRLDWGAPGALSTVRTWTLLDDGEVAYELPTAASVTYGYEFVAVNAVGTARSGGEYLAPS